MKHTKSLQEYFDVRYEPVTESGCWLWTGTMDYKGYGVVGFNRRVLKAHRISYELHKGPIPEGLCVCHKCDTPCCVNPDHLWTGTNKENVADSMLKGRKFVPTNKRGEGNHQSKLTAEKVRCIRRDERSTSAIAKDYNVCQQMISKIRRRKVWQHID